jgi:raffinose/stachyose/melibiose transport system substrate-binding protein
LIGTIATLLAIYGITNLLQSKSNSSNPYIYYINFKPESDSILQELAKLYTKKTGIEVTVLSPSSGNYGEILKKEMASSKPPTLFVEGGLDYLSEYADNIYDLKNSKVAGELNMDDLKIIDSEGKLAGIGYCFETFGLIVNTELLEKAGHKIDEIKNFTTLKKVAEDIHSNANKNGFDAFTSSGLDSSSSWRFSGHLANVPLFYESRDDGIWKKTPEKIKGTYLQNYKNLWHLYIKNSAATPNKLSSGEYNAEKEFGEKKAVFYQNGNWEYDALVNNYKLDPANLTMIPLYSNVNGEENAGLNTGTENYWIVNKKASENSIKATLDFMYWLVTDSEATKKLAVTFGLIPFKKAVEPENVFLKKAGKLEDDGFYTMLWTFNLTPNVDEWRKNLVEALNTYTINNSDANWELVKKAFVDGWEEQYKKKK